MEEAANNGISNLPDSLEALHINMEEDRISNLPDSLLHHIISFLEIKDAAGTSILSKRWNYIWTTVPTLDFQIRVFDPTSSKNATRKYMDFVDGTLHRHSGNVDKFAISWPLALNESRVHSWVSNVIKGKVKQLVLHINQSNPLFVPLSLFTCESLVSLELATHYSSGFTFPKSISLPRLKRLNLTAFKFSDECWNGELFSNSPVLEELILLLCKFRMRNFCILIPTLKLLKIHVSPGEEIGLDCVFKIDAPRLISFSYSGYVAKEFILSSFPSLVKATVNTEFEGNDGAEEIIRLLRAVAHVKCLTVSDKTLSLLTFRNVKNLKISDHPTTDEILIALLTAIPNLESLVFAEYMNHEGQEDNDEGNVNSSEEDNENDSEDYEDDSEGEWYEDDEDGNEGDGDEDDEDEGDAADTPECGSDDECEDNYENQDNSWELDIVTAGCLFSCLKLVCFQRFVGNPRELGWVKLILMNAKALQNMSIRYFDCDLHSAYVKSKKELRVRIQSFPRASAGCAFKFYAWDRSNWQYTEVS